MRALSRASVAALLVALTAPSVANAQRYQEPRWGEAPPWVAAERTEESARELANRAARLEEGLRRIEGNSELSERARRLARTADQLARELDAGVRYGSVIDGYEQLQREYLDLRGLLFSEHRARALEGVVDDWTRVASSFERLSLDLGIEESELCVLEPRERYGRYDDRAYDRDGFVDRYDSYELDPRLSRVPR